MPQFCANLTLLSNEYKPKTIRAAGLGWVQSWLARR